MAAQGSSLFLADTTNIDHAYIDDRGMIVGGSYRPKFIVTGKVDPVENVVVDFSTIKKSLKAIIDDKDEGYDHKLWWYSGWSKGDIVISGDRVVIETPFLRIETPRNAVTIISPEDGFEEYLIRKARDIYPDVDLSIATEMTQTFDEMPQFTTGAHSFRYVHGLKDSTSWGCQNIGHGHLSYIAARTNGDVGTIIASERVLSRIADEVNDTIFVWRDNLVDDGIVYECSRGRMSMMFKQDVKHVVLDTETTVEHLVDYIADTYRDDLIKAGVEELFVSEGLSKGACVIISP